MTTWARMPSISGRWPTTSPNSSSKWSHQRRSSSQTSFTIKPRPRPQVSVRPSKTPGRFTGAPPRIWMRWFQQSSLYLARKQQVSQQTKSEETCSTFPTSFVKKVCTSLTQTMPRGKTILWIILWRTVTHFWLCRTPPPWTLTEQLRGKRARGSLEKTIDR